MIRRRQFISLLGGRFAVASALKKLTPVRLPPGRGRLATRPCLTGSSDTPNTMGIVVVASLAASRLKLRAQLMSKHPDEMIFV
jgi:hypothetical protein